jgi:hypothetical protein
VGDIDGRERGEAMHVEVDVPRTALTHALLLKN